ncbi:hypothetical protein AAU61_03625 [Desulfocarbo indianensis]|nr:hypothetical protein AAU61_03625 [Desulfocarbo indianensis]
MKVRLSAWLLASALALSAPAGAAPSPGQAAPAGPRDFEEAVNQARLGLKDKDPARTLNGLRRAVAAAWKRLPFTAIEVHLVAAPPTGFGEYLPRVDNVYRPSEPLILYLEPVGFGVNHDKEKDAYSYLMSADFNLVDSWGHVVSGRRQFGRFEGESRHFPSRLPLSFTYSLSGLPPGEYRLETVLRDMLGKKSHTIVTPIRIEGP